MKEETEEDIKNIEYLKKSMEIIDRICFELGLEKPIDGDVFNAAMIGYRIGLEEGEQSRKAFNEK